MPPFKKFKLGEVADFKTGKLNSNASVPGGKYPFFTCDPTNLQIDTFAFDCEALLLAGNNADGVFALKYYKGKFNAYQRTYILTIKDDVDFDYKYLLYSLGLQLDFLKSVSQGSATKFLTMGILNELEIDAPSDLPTQTRIASILSALDDKIELNHQTNQTLEQMAQALFKKYFVTDIDPDNLPKGWRKDVFANHFDTEKGLSYKGSGLCAEGEGIPMHNLNSVYEGGGYKYEGLKFYKGEFKERHLIQAWDTIVTNTEQGHKFLLIGCPAVIPSFLAAKAIFTHHIYRIRPKGNSFLTAQYLYYLIMHTSIRDQIISCTNGTTVNMLNIAGLRIPEFCVPTKQLVDTFTKLISPIWRKLEGLHLENQSLTKLRDTLLPKLMSGEIEVNAPLENTVTEQIKDKTKAPIRGLGV